jgi:hypothetical protein
MLAWSRRLFLVPYVATVCAIFAAYVISAGVDVRALVTRNLAWGLLAMLAVSVILVRNVLSQPATPRSEGGRLVFELGWYGIVYGAIDGLFLSVFPVVLVAKSFPTLASTPVGMVAAGALALVASAAITSSYHFGYVEFRSLRMIRLAVFGNSVMTMGYLLSLNPLAAVGSHAIMHVAAVWHGSEGTAQLPPHYLAPASDDAAAVRTQPAA